MFSTIKSKLKSKFSFMLAKIKNSLLVTETFSQLVTSKQISTNQKNQENPLDPQPRRSKQSYTFEQNVGRPPLDLQEFQSLQTFTFGEQDDSYSNYSESDFHEDCAFYFGNFAATI